MWDTAKTLPRGKLLTNAYFKNEERSQISNLNFYLKKLEKEQNKHKASGKKEIIKGETAEFENREWIRGNKSMKKNY